MKWARGWAAFVREGRPLRGVALERWKKDVGIKRRLGIELEVIHLPSEQRAFAHKLSAQTNGFPPYDLYTSGNQYDDVEFIKLFKLASPMSFYRQLRGFFDEMIDRNVLFTGGVHVNLQIQGEGTRSRYARQQRPEYRMSGTRWDDGVLELGNRRKGREVKIGRIEFKTGPSCLSFQELLGKLILIASLSIEGQPTTEHAQMVQTTSYARMRALAKVFDDECPLSLHWSGTYTQFTERFIKGGRLC